MKLSVSLLYRGPQQECKNEFSQFVPHGLFNILFHLLKQGVDAKLYNLSNFKDRELKGFFRDIKSDFYLISSFFGNHWESFKLAELIKTYHKSSVVVLGGPLGVYGTQVLKKCSAIDFVSYGEGEITAYSLIKSIKERKELDDIPNLFFRKGKDIIRTKAYFHNNIDDFFFLPSQIMPYLNYVAQENLEVIITSRGCPFNCSFCSSPSIWGRKLRSHSINLILKYIKDLRENFGSLFFSIRDDNFISNKKRVIELSESLQDERLSFIFNLQGSSKFIDEETAERLSLSGCNQIQIGIENLSPQVLKLFNKKIDIERLSKNIKLLRRYCIEPFGYFITGVDETEEELEKTLRFIERSGIMSGVVSPLVLYPETKLSEVYRPDFFADKREIIYFSRKSYNKNLPLFKSAFTKAQENYFTLEEINFKKDGITRVIAKAFYLCQVNRIVDAISHLEQEIKRDSKNPLLYYYLSEICLTYNHAKAKKFLNILNRLLNYKNKMIKDMLNETRL